MGVEGAIIEGIVEANFTSSSSFHFPSLRTTNVAHVASDDDVEGALLEAVAAGGSFCRERVGVVVVAAVCIRHKEVIIFTTGAAAVLPSCRRQRRQFYFSIGNTLENDAAKRHGCVVDGIAVIVSASSIVLLLTLLTGLLGNCRAANEGQKRRSSSDAWRADVPLRKCRRRRSGRGCDDQQWRCIPIG